MKLLVDMNLSPRWVSVLAEAGMDQPDAFDQPRLRLCASISFFATSRAISIVSLLAPTEN